MERELLRYRKTFSMKTTYQISLLIKTPTGFETYGHFDLGTNRDQAMAIIEQLKGTDDVTGHSVLYMDFNEIRDGIPYPIRIMHCTLDDIAENTRIITRDTFKNLSL